LPLADASVDGAFAISIWSHFDSGAAIAWLEEMARVVRPGGHLLLTTQGWGSIAFFARLPGNEAERQRPIIHSLYRDGFAFVDVFTGEDGDWGVPADNWGMGFMTAEWLAQTITPRWSIVLFRSGAAEGNQDVYVLRRTAMA
jgi:SAM-dependent methyltransferase